MPNVSYTHPLWASKKNDSSKMRYRIIILSIVIFIFGLISCDFSGDIFTDETYKDTLTQNIGGSLIRDIHHYNDFHSFNYDIEYSYKDENDSIYKIGLGSFYAQEPPRDEQLMRFGKWIIFKTSGDRDKDFIYIGDNTNWNSWTKYEISPESIELQDLWKAQNIKTRTDNWDAVAKVETIDKNGQIIIKYTFVRERFIPFFKTGKRKIICNVNNVTGKLDLIRIKE